MINRGCASFAGSVNAPEVFAEGLLALFEFHNDNLQLGDKTWLVAGRFYLWL